MQDVYVPRAHGCECSCRWYTLDEGEEQRETCVEGTVAEVAAVQAILDGCWVCLLLVSRVRMGAVAVAAAVHEVVVQVQVVRAFGFVVGARLGGNASGVGVPVPVPVHGEGDMVELVVGGWFGSGLGWGRRLPRGLVGRTMRLVGVWEWGAPGPAGLGGVQGACGIVTARSVVFGLVLEDVVGRGAW